MPTDNQAQVYERLRALPELNARRLQTAVCHTKSARSVNSRTSLYQ